MGKVDCVVVKDLSRFGREYIDSGKYIERLFPALGVRFIAVNDHIDSKEESGSSEQPVLLKYIGEELEKLIKVYPYPVPIPEVVNCSFYNDANLIGALFVLLQNSIQG